MINKFIVILGPTASGKTDWALALAKKFNGEIISADSRQLYKEMNIGTAKPSTSELKIIKHHLINQVKPNYNFTLADYLTATRKKLKNIQRRQKIPFLVGGNGLYLSAIIDNYDLPKGKIDLRLRQRLEQKTTEELFTTLRELDLQTAKNIDRNNKRRLIRALEYVIINKRSFSANQQKQQSHHQALIIGIEINRLDLNARIDQRVDKMIEIGLVKEVKKLIKKYDYRLPSLQTIGYQEIIDYLQGKHDLTEAIKLIKIHTHQYAKRQMTWFKRMSNVHWLENIHGAEKIIKSFLK